MANNRFDKKIILLTIKKVCFFANVKSNEFFNKTIVVNVLSFQLYKKAILQARNLTFYDNYHIFIANLLDISLLVKYIIDNSIFKEKLGYTDI